MQALQLDTQSALEGPLRPLLADAVSRISTDPDLAEFDNWSMDMKFRTHPRLVDVVERLGHRANGRFADLGIVEIPDDAINPRIDEYDGNESVTEGREWR